MTEIEHPFSTRIVPALGTVDTVGMTAAREAKLVADQVSAGTKPTAYPLSQKPPEGGSFVPPSITINSTE